MLALLGDGGALLASETARLMHGRQFGHHPRLDGMAFGFVVPRLGRDPRTR
jgi:hypothetical protein